MCSSNITMFYFFYLFFLFLWYFLKIYDSSENYFFKQSLPRKTLLKIYFKHFSNDWIYVTTIFIFPSCGFLWIFHNESFSTCAIFSPSNVPVCRLFGHIKWKYFKFFNWRCLELLAPDRKILLAFFWQKKFKSES